MMLIAGFPNASSSAVEIAGFVAHARERRLTARGGRIAMDATTVSASAVLLLKPGMRTCQILFSTF